MDRDAFASDLAQLLRKHGLENHEYLDVRAFHQKFNQIIGYKPQFISQRLAKERFDFMLEELAEWWEKGVLAHNMEELADGLIDLVYVAKGTAVMMGLPWRELWDDVQRANLAKVPGTTHRGTTHDVRKPEGWVGPKTTEVLKKVGYDPTDVWRDVDYPDSGIKSYRGARLCEDEGCPHHDIPHVCTSVSQRPEDPTIYPENPIGGLER